MYGEGVGTLKLSVATQSSPNPAASQWQKIGSQGNVWKMQQLQFSQAESFWIIFEGLLVELFILFIFI